MFKIELTDPHKMNKKALFKIAKFIFELSGNEIAEDSPNYEIGINLENKTVEARPKDTEIYKENPLRYDPTKKYEEPQITITSVEGTTTEESQLVPDEDLERDASGDLWDKKIHSRTRSKDADGNWKLQRNIMKAMPAEAGVAQHAVVPPPPPPIDPTRNFGEFVQRVTKAISDSKLHTTKLLEILNKHGIADLPAVPSVPGGLEKVWDEVMEAIKL